MGSWGDGVTSGLADDRADDGADLGSNDEQDSRNSIFNGHWEALFLSRKEGEHAEWHNVDISEMDWYPDQIHECRLKAALRSAKEQCSVAEQAAARGEGAEKEIAALKQDVSVGEAEG